MIDLSSIPLYEANPANYNPSLRKKSSIKYVVMHYTSNIGDTAKNNVVYFHNTVTKSSAHYFVSDGDIQQSVPLLHAAYAVGLGTMKGPYTGTNPEYYKVCTNSNSVSIELCGSKQSREASAKTKQTACELAVTLLHELNLTPSAVIRHYDVTGKNCPAWAVEDPLKWLEIQTEINHLFYHTEEDEMKNNDENYAVFKAFMDRYLSEKAAESPAWAEQYMQWAKQLELMNDGKPQLPITRAEAVTVLYRMSERMKEGRL